MTGSEAGDGIRCGAQWPAPEPMGGVVVHKCGELCGHHGFHRCWCGWPGPLTATEPQPAP